MSLSGHAVSYAGLGLEIFPVGADKRPLHSQLEATTDADQIEAWWRRWPEALIGHRISAHHLLLDIDPRHGGKATWKALRAELPAFVTRAHFSGRGDGGGHVWFQRPGDALTVTKLDAWARERGLGADLEARWSAGIDLLRHEHRYTILPPSPHPETAKPYRWKAGCGLGLAPAPMPAMLAELLTKDELRAPATSSGPQYRDPDSIADWFSETHGLAYVLAPKGWALVAGDGETDGSRWRHPEATTAVSATVRHGCLFVYSTSTAFEVTTPDEPHGYTPFRAWATLEHGGNLSVAGAAARKLKDASERKPRVNEASELGSAREAYSVIYALAATAGWGPIGLDAAHAVFRRWLGDEYDLDALDATLATAAAERLGGDPLWLLIVSGSGNAKTETVQALRGAGAYICSTIASDGALLSGTPHRSKIKGATGGLLREIGDRGLLVIKDVTSILSMNRDTRTSILAAIREIHDGHWIRYLGSDGGKTLEWSGRLVLVGAVTTKWDRAHDVVASMGDRFVICRMDSSEGRLSAGRQARRNVDHEEQMRCELANAVTGVLAGMTNAPESITDDESEHILAAADLVTKARTGVEHDYKGDVIDAHAPEMPTRFMKQLVQMVRGGLAIGMDRTRALQLAIRCARDSLPPLRLAVLDDIATHPDSTTIEVTRRLDKPRNTLDRQLMALHVLRVLRCRVEPNPQGGNRWRYSLADGIDPSTLHVPVLSEQVHKGKFVVTSETSDNGETPRDTSDISGTRPDDEPRVKRPMPDSQPYTPMKPICPNCGAETLGGRSCSYCNVGAGVPAEDL